MKASKYNHVFAMNDGTYLYNSLWRGLHKVEDSVVSAVSAIERGNPELVNALPDAYRETLKEHHYVLDDTFDEEAVIRSQREALQHDKRALSLTIAPTLDCNFGCPYCFEGSNKPRPRMTNAVIDAIIAFADRMCTNETKVLSVTWFGGEPLLALPQIERLTALLRAFVGRRQMAYKASIITNGYGLTHKTAAKLKALGVEWAQVTLDGTAEYHNRRRFLKASHGPTFQRIVDNIAEACDDLRISVRVNIDHSNRDGYLPLAEMLREDPRIGTKVKPYPAFTDDLGDYSWECSFADLDSFVTAQADIYSGAPELGDVIFPYPRATRVFCGAQSDMTWVIAPNGDLHKCWDTIADETQAVGSVISGVDDTRASYWLNWGAELEKCQSCRLAPLCMGGCAYKALVRNGEPQCQVSLDLVKYSVGVLAKTHATTHPSVPEPEIERR